MSTLLKREDRESILGRLHSLTPEKEGLWGKMSAHEAICHMADHLAVALGEIPSRREDNWLSRSVAKWLFIKTPMPIPKAKIDTAPEMLTTVPEDWDDDISRCETLINRFATDNPDSPHPAFGPMVPSDWGVLCYRHMDHHLRQFGS
jgi:hypothetical protein